MKTGMIIYTSGDKKIIRPENGSTFSLEELQKIVGGWIETVRAKDGRVIVLNEEGKLNGLLPNVEATELYCDPADDIIVGNVLVCDEDLLN